MITGMRTHAVSFSDRPYPHGRLRVATSFTNADSITRESVQVIMKVATLFLMSKLKIPSSRISF